MRLRNKLTTMAVAAVVLIGGGGILQPLQKTVRLRTIE